MKRSYAENISTPREGILCHFSCNDTIAERCRNNVRAWNRMSKRNWPVRRNKIDLNPQGAKKQKPPSKQQI